MQNKELNINEVVRVDTLPVIFQQLELVGSYVDGELLKVKELECTEENKNEVKKIRANINSLIKQFEDKRKEIKQQVLDPYNQFNDKYEEAVKLKLEEASAELKVAIDDIERKQIEQKENEIFAFIDEHIHANHIEKIIMTPEVICFANLKINLSTSIKSLKEDAKAYIEKVAMEVKLIELEDKYNDEILWEYQKNGYNFNKAKLDVVTKHKELEELAKQREQVKEVVQQEEVVEKVVEEIVAPKEVIQEDEDIITVTFKITDTKENIIKVREYMKKEGIKYE